jgi:hypothetical protein
VKEAAQGVEQPLSFRDRMQAYTARPQERSGQETLQGLGTPKAVIRPYSHSSHAGQTERETEDSGERNITGDEENAAAASSKHKTEVGV